MAAELSWQMVNEDDPDNRIDLVIVIVPWKSIQGDQTAGMIKTFDRRGLRVRDRLMLRGSRIVQQPVPSNLDAIVTTYQEAMSAEGIDTIRLWKSKGLRIAVLFDEIHHANEINGSWGEFADQASQLCEMTIVMSGTFFRTDGKRIKFVTYGSDDRPQPDCCCFS